MGSGVFPKVFRYACLAAIALAAAFLAAIYTANPAAAKDGERDRGLKEWDTDNLAASGRSAKNYRIPFHDYSGENPSRLLIWRGS